MSAESIQLSTFKKELYSSLRSIPKRIASPFCRTEDKRSWDDVMRRDDFEEYLTPNEEARYRISSSYLIGSDVISVKFQGSGYGDFTVCLSRDLGMLSKECKSVQDMENVWFNITQPCSNQNAENGCLSVYFSIQVDTTYMRCSESDCRFPDEVRISIRPEGMRCERSGMKKFTAELSLLLLSFFIVSLV